MKRVVGLAVLFLVCMGSSAWADCAMNSGGAAANSESFADGPVVSGSPGGLSCSITSTIQVPTGYYGVFKADARGSVHQENSADSGVLSVDAFSKTGSATVTGATDQDVEFTTYYATGLTSTPTGFDGTATAAIAGTDANAMDSLDSVDLLMAYTTQAQQNDSFSIIGLQQLALATHLDETGGLLIGGNQPLEGPNEIGLIGGVGSYTLGVTGRFNLAEGFSLLGGASIVDFAAPGTSAHGVLAEGAIRYVQPGNQEFRLMGEVGGELAPLGVTFSRHYEDGFAGTDASGSGDALLGSLYAKGGVLWSPTADDDLLFSATLKQGAFGIGSFVEDDPDTNPNLFAADLSGTSQSITLVKVGTDWTHKLGQGADLTASLAVGAASGSGATGTVFGVGAVTGAAQTTYFADYGLRVGWELAPGSRVDGFVAGSSGTGIGTHAQVGADYRMSF